MLADPDWFQPEPAHHAPTRLGDDFDMSRFSWLDESTDREQAREPERTA